MPVSVESRNHQNLSAAVERLRDLVAFDTTSTRSNLGMIEYMQRHFDGLGCQTTLLHDRTGEKANLIASIGPADTSGIVLSGHTDVVPANPRKWTSDPFHLVQRDDRLYGRGTCDMKGFAACLMAAAPDLIRGSLARPFHFCFSYDEEVGCLGAPDIAKHLSAMKAPPGLAIIGEPSEMRLINGQKGKISMRVTVCGDGGHSSFSPQHVNAVEFASKIIVMIAERGRQYEREGPFDDDFSVPCSTTLATLVTGGVATNVTPDSCEFVFELRSIDQNAARADMKSLIESIEEKILPEMRERSPRAGIEWQEAFSYPAMGDASNTVMFKEIEPILPERGGKVSYGSEGGVFEVDGGIPSVIIGPGSIRQAHNPDEFIEIDQLRQCLGFFDVLGDWMKR